MSDNLQGIERLCEDMLARVLPIVQTLIGDPEATISNIVYDLEREEGARICLTTHSDTKCLSFYTLDNRGAGQTLICGPVWCVRTEDYSSYDERVEVFNLTDFEDKGYIQERFQKLEKRLEDLWLQERNENKRLHLDHMIWDTQNLYGPEIAEQVRAILESAK